MKRFKHIKNYALFYKVLLLLLILLITLSLRIYLNYKLPVENRHNYPNHYLHAVSYAAGGLDYDKLKVNVNSYMLAGIDHDTKGSSLSKPLDDFLNSKVDILDIQSLEIYKKDNIRIYELLNNNTYGGFEQYVAAYVWKIFGISWRNLFYFYSFVSTLAGLSLFLLGRKVTKSYWGGIFVATIYAFSSPELYGGVWSIRDASPVWFFAFLTTYFFAFTGIYKKQWANYISYYFLGVITLIGIGWRADSLLFFPLITFFLIVKLYLERKSTNNKIKNIFIYFILFVFGSYSILTLNNKLSAPSTPFGFMHIALYGEKLRSDVGIYENTFQNQFNDYQTLWQIQHYQKHKYPNHNNVQLMQGEYGKYCLELYYESLKYNIYQWISTYPKYFYHTFLLKDVTLKKLHVFRQTQNKTIQYLWNFTVYLAIVSVIFLLIAGIYCYTLFFFTTFTIYYSIVYWSVLPQIKHIMIMSIPISVLAGIFLFYLFNIRSIKIKKMNKKKLFTLLTYSILIFLSYQLMSYIAMQYSIKTNKTYISKINSIAKNGKDITSDINLNWKNEFSIDLSRQKPVAIMVNFTTDGEKDLVTIHDKYNKWGKITPITYKYTVESQKTNHTLFTTCMGFEINDKYIVKIQLPSSGSIVSVKLINLDDWNGLSYGTVFSTTNDRTPGSLSVNLKNSVKYRLYKKSKDSTFLLRTDEHNFTVVAFNNREQNPLISTINRHTLLWKSTSIRDHIWISKKNVALLNIINTPSILHALFKANASILNQNLLVRLHLYDSNNKLLYKTKLHKMDDIVMTNNNTYEMAFDISEVSNKANKFRMFFYAREPGKYVIPKVIEIFQTQIKQSI